MTLRNWGPMMHGTTKSPRAKASSCRIDRRHHDATDMFPSTNNGSNQPLESGHRSRPSLPVVVFLLVLSLCVLCRSDRQARLLGKAVAKSVDDDENDDNAVQIDTG